MGLMFSLPRQSYLKNGKTGHQKQDKTGIATIAISITTASTGPTGGEKIGLELACQNYQQPGTGDITMSLAGLPDFITESNKKVTPPNWLLNNPGTRVVARENYRVSDYLIEWQSDWVKRFGIDGFRVDTVKHSGRRSVAATKTASFIKT